MQLEFNLPTPLAFLIAEPWILYKGRLFQPAESIEDLADDYVEFNNGKLNLEEIESPKGLEELYFIKYSREIERFESQFMRRAANAEYRSASVIEQELGRNKILSLLVTKVLPVITNFNLDDQLSKMIEEEQGRAHQDNFIEIMASNSRRRSSSSSSSRQSANIERELQRQKQSLIDTISREYRQFEVERNTNNHNAEPRNAVLSQLAHAIESRGAHVQEITPLEDGSILTSHIFPGRNIMFYNNGIYELVTVPEWISYFQQHINPGLYRTLQRTPATRHPHEVYDQIKENLSQVEKMYLSSLMNKLKTSMVKLEGKYYLPILMKEDKADVILLLYKKLIEKEVKLKAIEHNEFQAVQMYEISKQREQLERIANLDRFDLNGAGYEKQNDVYYVYVTTPEYALKSPHIRGEKRYLPMPPAKIGVGVYYDSHSRRIVVSNPVIMNRYRHPFIPYRGEPMYGICLGTYDPSRAKHKPPEEAIMTLLSKSKEIILMGYRRGSSPYPDNSLKESLWRGWITKREVERRGLVCLNEFDD